MAEPLDLAAECPPDPPPPTPQPILNAPGQPSLAARIGNQPRFLQAMIDDVVRQPALDGLKVAEGGDPTIGLLDAWATVLDVLTFYQERIANEGYLGTAIERRSLLELARMIGYELAPGVATDTHLAFTLDAAAAQAGVPGTTAAVTLAAGLAAQSVPGPGETPQTFETVEPLTARADWNAVAAAQTRPIALGTGSTELWIQGLHAELRRGDLILIVGNRRKSFAASDRWDVRALDKVVLDTAGQRTQLRWAEPLGSTLPPMQASDTKDGFEIWGLHGRAQLFGANAPDVRLLHESIRSHYQGGIAETAEEWPRFTIAGDHGGSFDKFGGGTVQLDGAHALVAGQWLMLQVPGWRELYAVEEAADSAVHAFGLAAKTTLVKLSGENLKRIFNDRLRATSVFIATDRYEPIETPDISDVAGETVTLERLVDGLALGQTVALSEQLPPPVPGGLPATAAPGEVRTIKQLTVANGRTVVTFDTPLARKYPRAAFRLHANVARATHGATVEEVLGSGDAAATFQSFALKQKPLTYTSAASPSGRASTLEIRVSRLRWQEVESLIDQPSDARVYIVRAADDGTATVTFGDGITGARLPTGRENVTAAYRIGVGSAGRVRDRQISLLMSRPIGLTAVSNVAAPTGGADPESRDDARVNAPGTVMTLGRIVSLKDFEEFARTFAGIAKARATRVWTGRDWIVHLTIAAASGEALPAGHTLLATLAAAIDAVRDTTRAMTIADHTVSPVTIRLRLVEVADALFDDVAAALRAALFRALGRPARALGDPLPLSRIIQIAQAVPGVRAIDVDVLRTGTQDGIAHGGLEARLARLDGHDLRPAELLYLDTLEIERMLP